MIGHRNRIGAAMAIALVGAMGGAHLGQVGQMQQELRQVSQQLNGPATPDKTAVSPTGDVDRRTARQRQGGSPWTRSFPGQGWSVAQDRRNARKKRNVKAHRKACK